MTEAINEASAPNAAALGRNPAANGLMLALLIVGGGGAIVAAMLTSGDRGLMFVGAFALLGLCFAALFGLGILITGLASLPTYLRAKAAVAEGKVKPDSVIRGMLCNGIVVVDNDARKLFVNDGIYSFDDIRNVQWECVPSGKTMAYMLRIAMRSGNRPLKSVQLDTEDKLMQAFSQIENAIS